MKTIRRRRLEGKTDYKARLALLKSGQARFVIRKTNKYLVAQVVETKIAQDNVVTGLSSRDLIEKGWPKDSQGSLKSLAAAYTLGFLVGKQAQAKKVSSAIADFGMIRNIHKSRIYAVLKGAVDSGLKIPHKGDTMPSLDDVKKDKDLAQVMHKLTKQ